MDENQKVVWSPLEISSSTRFSSITAYKFIYSKFVHDEKYEELYKKKLTGSYFRSTDRIKLLIVSREAWGPAERGGGGRGPLVRIGNFGGGVTSLRSDLEPSGVVHTGGMSPLAQAE